MPTGQSDISESPSVSDFISNLYLFSKDIEVSLICSVVEIQYNVIQHFQSKKKQQKNITEGKHTTEQNNNVSSESTVVNS